MRRLVLVLLSFVVLAACSASVAAGATAHNTRWHWAKVEAQKVLYRQGLNWDSGFETVDYADCRGRGSWIWNNAHTKRLYKHFNCYVETDQPDPYWIRFHVLGKFKWDYDFLYYDYEL